MRPTTSTDAPRGKRRLVNFVAGQSIPNLVIVKLGASGKISVAASVSAGTCKKIGSVTNPNPGHAGDLLLFSAGGFHPDVSFPIQRMGTSSASIVACNGGSFSDAFDVGSKISVTVISNN
jgi:hypothetical protein